MMRIDWMLFLRASTYLGLCSYKILSQSEHLENFDDIKRHFDFFCVTPVGFLVAAAILDDVLVTRLPSCGKFDNTKI